MRAPGLSAVCYIFVLPGCVTAVSPVCELGAWQLCVISLCDSSVTCVTCWCSLGAWQLCVTKWTSYWYQPVIYLCGHHFERLEWPIGHNSYSLVWPGGHHPDSQPDPRARGRQQLCHKLLRCRQVGPAQLSLYFWSYTMTPNSWLPFLWFEPVPW